MPPSASGHGHQTHWAKIFLWFGSGPNWSPFPALPQPLRGFLCPQTPTSLSDLRAALWTSYIPRSKGLPFPPNDSWPTWIEVFSSKGSQRHWTHCKKGQKSFGNYCTVGIKHKKLRSKVCLPRERQAGSNIHHSHLILGRLTHPVWLLLSLSISYRVLHA